MKLGRKTPWFDGDRPPRHLGVYERQDGPPFSCWDRVHWLQAANTPEEAAQMDTPDPNQSIAWRGLVKRSTAPCETCRGHQVLDSGPSTDVMEPCPDC